MILVNYNVVTKKATINSTNADELNWVRSFENIGSVTFNLSHQHATITFIKDKESQESTSLIYIPDEKKIEYSFTTNLPYLYTEDQYVTTSL
jgi:hypothetical protein